MRTSGWSGWALLAVIATALGSSGCKTMSERYIALEVWKYERCFGHLPPGFVPPGAQAAAGAPGRVCGQSGPAPCGPAAGCDECGGGMMSGGVSGGVPMGISGPAPGGPTPAGVTAGRPVVISDELVVP